MKNPLWKQPTPVDQLTAIRASLEWHVSNWNDGIITATKLYYKVTEHLAHIKSLEPFLRGDEKW